jgi:hypothetical protein
MKEKERRRVATQLLDELRGEVLAAVERMRSIGTRSS